MLNGYHAPFRTARRWLYPPLDFSPTRRHTRPLLLAIYRRGRYLVHLCFAARQDQKESVHAQIRACCWHRVRTHLRSHHTRIGFRPASCRSQRCNIRQIQAARSAILIQHFFLSDTTHHIKHIWGEIEICIERRAPGSETPRCGRYTKKNGTTLMTTNMAARSKLSLPRAAEQESRNDESGRNDGRCGVAT